MAGVKISGAEHPVKDIFSDQFLFEIPSYQRAYAWGVDEASALLDDLLYATNAGSADDPDPYFLGSIVLAKEEASAAAKVIDGQQRLTTLTILLAVLAASFPESEAEELRQFIRQKGNTFAGTADVMRLTLRPRDAEMFRDRVQLPTSLDELVNCDPAQLDNDAQRNIRANARVFTQRLAELDEPSRRRLGQFLISDCFLVVVSTPDRDSAYRIFAVLNDRGLDLSHADILKSELIGSINGPVEEAQYTDRWEDTEAELGVEAFRDLFSHIRMIYAKDKQREVLLKEFRERVLSRVEDPRTFIDEVIVPWGDAYSRVRDAAWESSTHSTEINTWLSWLGRIDNFDWVPPAIVFLDRHRHDSPRIEQFLGRLERLAATMYIRRAGINERVDRYAALLTEIEQTGDVMDTGSSLDLTDEERASTLRRLDGDIYLDKTRLYVLLRLDHAKNAGGATYDHKILTVEHVLPQGPDESSEWVKLFTEDQRTTWTHRLGNLVLLTRRKNSSAQNFDFEKKKSKYFAGPDGASPFLLTMDVLQTPTWTPAVVEARQRQVLDTLENLWDL